MRAVFTCVYVSESARGRERMRGIPTHALRCQPRRSPVGTYGNRPCAASLRTLLHSAAAATLLQAHCCTLYTHAVITMLTSDLNGASKNGVLFDSAGCNKIRDDCFVKWPTLFQTDILVGCTILNFSYRTHYDCYYIKLLLCKIEEWTDAGES